MLDASPSPPSLPLDEQELLEDGECILVVDDIVEMADLVREFLQEQGLTVIVADSADSLWREVERRRVALVLLDIGLPDASGLDLLPRIKQHDEDLSVIMLTAVTDLQTVLSCLRWGADDYLAKPVQFRDLLGLVRRVLEKRRLAIRNRQYQREIEQANFRLQFSHELAIKMNSAYLSMVELDEILHAILVGITANEGLQFNRAFLALFSENGDRLDGRLAIGPDSREEGARIWREVRDHSLGLHDFFARAYSRDSGDDREVNRIIQALHVDAMDSGHLLIRAVRERLSIHVVNGQCAYPVPQDLVGLLGEDTFVVAPLFSPNRSLGLIIADHFVDRRPIGADRIRALESFASQASLVIEHCRLYTGMQLKIKELEEVTSELRKNKDLLIESERYSALGHMAAQLAHSIRNPITTIGGTARLLARKLGGKDWGQFLDLIVGESEKIEKSLDSLFDFVQLVKPECEEARLGPLLHKALLLHLDILGRQKIRYLLQLPERDPLVFVDLRLMQQAFVHLVRNSIETMPAGGELDIEVLEEERNVRVEFRDSGHARDCQDSERAADPLHTTKMIGAGMGLTLVRRIIEDHGGNLSLYSGCDGGCWAAITLARRDEG